MLSKRPTFQPFLTFPNKVICLRIIPSISDRPFLIDLHRLNYSYLSQHALWRKTITAKTRGLQDRRRNYLEILSLLNALIEAFFVRSFFWTLITNYFFQIYKQNDFLYTSTTDRRFITVNLSSYFIVKNHTKYTETIVVNSSDIALDICCFTHLPPSFSKL